MSRKCQITGKKPMSARHVSHAHNVTPRWQKPNIQRKRIYVAELGRWVRLRISTRAMRTLDKKGLLRFLKDEGLTLKDVT
ncbi:MAG: 50S ribosomal protein L28 [Acidobacteria bacterium]|nr:50S ribosomal protein L28 [Acidobacteriota bacterium]